MNHRGMLCWRRRVPQRRGCGAGKMPAPAGNRNAAKEGEGRLIRVRLSPFDFDLVVEALSPEERGAALLAAANEVLRRALTVMGECPNCGEFLNATEWRGEGTLCASCEALRTAGEPGEEG